MSAIDKCEGCPLLESVALTPEQTESYLHYLEHGGENPLDALFPTASELARVEKERDEARSALETVASRCGVNHSDDIDWIADRVLATMVARETVLDEARRELRASRWLQKTHPAGYELLGSEYVGLVGVDSDNTEHLTYSGAAESLGWKDDDGH